MAFSGATVGLLKLWASFAEGEPHALTFARSRKSTTSGESLGIVPARPASPGLLAELSKRFVKLSSQTLKGR